MIAADLILSGVVAHDRINKVSEIFAMSAHISGVEPRSLPARQRWAVEGNSPVSVWREFLGRAIGDDAIHIKDFGAGNATLYMVGHHALDDSVMAGVPLPGHQRAVLSMPFAPQKLLDVFWDIVDVEEQNETASIEKWLNPPGVRPTEIRDRDPLMQHMIDLGNFLKISFVDRAGGVNALRGEIEALLDGEFARNRLPGPRL